MAKNEPRGWTTGPLASIIIPTFNRRTLVTETIDSCLAQHYRDVEVIVVDDGSTDGTIDVLKDLSIRLGDSRFRYLTQRNLGPSAARNAGIDASRGEYVKFLDDDDTLDPDAIGSSVAVLESAKADLCIGSRRYMTFKGEKGPVHYRPEAGLIDGALSKFFDLKLRAQTGLWVFRRGLFDREIRWDTRLLAREDADLLARAMVEGARVAGAPDSVTEQRCHAGFRQRSREFEPEVARAIHDAHTRLYERMLEQGRLEDAGRAFAGSLCRTTVRWWGWNRELAKRCYSLAQQAHRRPELILSDNYPRSKRVVGYLLWAVGGPYLCAPVLKLYERTGSFRWRWRRRFQRAKAATAAVVRLQRA